MMIVIGSSAEPAARGPKPATTWSWTTSRKNIAPSAA